MSFEPIVDDLPLKNSTATNISSFLDVYPVISEAFIPGAAKHPLQPFLFDSFISGGGRHPRPFFPKPILSSDHPLFLGLFIPGGTKHPFQFFPMPVRFGLCMH